MDVKVAKFFPLGLAGLLGLKELFVLFINRGHAGWYFFPHGFYFDVYGLSQLTVLFCKVAVILAALFLAKLYFDNNTKMAKFVALGILGIFTFRNLLIYIFGGGLYQNAFLRISSLFILLAIIANIVIAFLVRGSEIPGQPRVQKQPVYYNQPPVQQYQPPMPLTPQGGQSIPDQLAALQSLVDNGTLTQAEFKAAKQRIIGG